MVGAVGRGGLETMEGTRELVLGVREPTETIEVVVGRYGVVSVWEGGNQQ